MRLKTAPSGGLLEEVPLEPNGCTAWAAGFCSVLQQPCDQGARSGGGGGAGGGTPPPQRFFGFGSGEEARLVLKLRAGGWLWSATWLESLK